MAEDETAALAEEVAWREKAMWLLIRKRGGEVEIADEAWERIPQEPKLIIDRADGLMRWTALEPGGARAAGELEAVGTGPLLDPDEGGPDGH